MSIMDTVRATPAEIQDEWAFDEAKNSPRFVGRYASLKVALLEKIRNGASSQTLDPVELSALREVHARHNGALIGALQGHSTYQRVQLRRAAFSKLMVWTSMSRTAAPVTFAEFARGERWRRSNGELHSKDPRVYVDSQTPGTTFPSHVPPIVIARSHGLLGVIDGFGRSLLFLKLQAPVSIRAWVPTEELANIG